MSGTITPMAQSDDHPIKVTSPEYKPVGQGAFETWLGKEAEEAQAARKTAAKLGDNEDQSTVDYADIYKNPPGRKDGSNGNGSWGEKPNMRKGEQAPFHLNRTSVDNANQERRDVTARALDSFPAASAVEQAILAKNLAHAASGEYETHSVLLHGGVKQASLSERVQKIVSEI